MNTRIVYRNTRHGNHGLRGGQLVTREQFLKWPHIVEQEIRTRVAGIASEVSSVGGLK